MGATRKTDQIYEVTGTLSPDVTGTYNPVGGYNGKNYYKLSTGDWYLWWDGVDTWTISTVLGTEGAAYWTRVDPAIEGVYSPGGTATGDATVAEVV